MTARLRSVRLLWIVPLLLLSACQDAGVVRLSDGARISFDALIGDLSKARVVVIGERHDDPSHHELQLKILRTLHERGVPLALGMEMLRADSQEQVDRWLRWGMPTEQFEAVFRENWGLPWHLYRDILFYARKQRIPVIGLNVPREIVSRVAAEGDKAYETHQSSTGRPFERFCEAQMAWDAAMASHAVAYLRANRDRRMILLAGSAHASR